MSSSPPITPIPIGDLISRYEKQLIAIPEFQRDFVWSSTQVKELIISLYKGYPIGMLIEWETPPELSSDIGRYWLIDGQQRLLSLVGVCKGSVVLKGGKIKNFALKFNPLTEDFQFDSPRIRGNPLWISIKQIIANPLSEIVNVLRKSAFLKEEEIKICERRLEKLKNNLTNYLVPVCTLRPDLEPEDAANIFIKLNATGTRVKAAELYIATFAIMFPGGIATEINDFMESMSNWDLDVSLVVRTILAFLIGRVRIASRVLEQARIIRKKYSAQQLKEAWLKAKEALKQTVDLLSSKWGIYGSELLPSQTALTPVAYYLGSRKTVNKDEVEKLLKWFLLASYWGRYSSAAETKLNEDLEAIREKENPWQDLLSNIRKESGRLLPSEDDFKGAEKDKLLMLYILLKENNVTSLLSDQEIRSDIIQIHHIFPRMLLKGLYRDELIEDIANKTFVIGRENMRIGNKEPIEYLWRRIDKTKIEAHFIPCNPNLLKRESFPEFLKERRKLIVAYLEKYFENL